jgi:hypothetical protein
VSYRVRGVLGKPYVASYGCSTMFTGRFDSPVPRRLVVCRSMFIVVADLFVSYRVRGVLGK